MTRHLLLFFYLTVHIAAYKNTSFNEFYVDSISETITDYKALFNFVQGALKCCPIINQTYPYSYNPIERACLNSSEGIDSEWKVLLFNQSSMTCDRDKVLVDIEILVSFALEDGESGTTEEIDTSTSESSIDCDNIGCDGFNSSNQTLGRTDTYGLSLEDSHDLSAGSRTKAERTKRIESARARSVISSRGTPSELPVSFLPGGRLRIGDEIHDPDGFCIDARRQSEDGTLYLTARVCEEAHRWCVGGRACVRNCCPDGESMVAKSIVLQNDEKGRMCHPYFLGFSVSKDPALRSRELGVFNGEVCGPRYKYVLRPEKYPEDVWQLQPDGSLVVLNMKHVGRVHFQHTGYCLDTVYSPRDNMSGIYAFPCFPDSEDSEVSLERKINTVMEGVVYLVAILISCVFLVATLVAYAILPSLRNLHGVTLVSHATCLLAAFICLTAGKFYSNALRGGLGCKVLGYSILFAFLSAFSWLSVMCFDIWWTFGQGRIRPTSGTKCGSSKSGGALQGHLHKFILYSVFAWMFPLIVTALTALVDAYGKDYLPYAPPMIGLVRCWFHDDVTWAVIIHFLGPSTILLVANVTMFILTAIRCWRIKAEIQRMQHSDKEDSGRDGDGIKKFGRKWWKQVYKADKDRLFMNLKLCAAMGVNWSLEIVSWWLSRGADNSESTSVLPKALWYLTDVTNCLHGVLVFIIFVGKKKILIQLWKKIKSLSNCCQQDIVREEGQNIRSTRNHLYNTSSLQDISASNEGKTYNFNEDDGKKIGRIQRWLINHGFHSRRKKNTKHFSRHLSKESTTTTSISADICRGNISYVP